MILKTTKFRFSSKVSSCNKYLTAYKWRYYSFVDELCNLVVMEFFRENNIRERENAVEKAGAGSK